MPAVNKTELLEVLSKEFGKFLKLIEPIEDQCAVQKREEDTSIKDVVAHRAHWIDLFLGWYADGQADKNVHFPAKGYKWNDLKRYNADLRQAQANMNWPEAKAELRTANKRLVNFIEDHSDAELYDGPMKGANNKWTPGRWAEAAGPSHFRSASKFVRGALKQTTKAS